MDHLGQKDKLGGGVSGVQTSFKVKFVCEVPSFNEILVLWQIAASHKDFCKVIIP